jgi:hypothetical protein
MRETQPQSAAISPSAPQRAPALGALDVGVSQGQARLQDFGAQVASAHRAALPPQQPVPPVRAPQPPPQNARPVANPPARSAEQANAVQQSITRIHDACQAPPLSPPEYRTLFEVMAKEINEGGLQGAQTLSNIESRALALGIDVRRDDVRFILEVVSEADPWFDQGATANLFAGRFRNFVVARCRSQGLSLSTDELDLIEAWFAGTGAGVAPSLRAAAPAQPQVPSAPEAEQPRAWGGDEPLGEEFPKILRTRLRG